MPFPSLCRGVFPVRCYSPAPSYLLSPRARFMRPPHFCNARGADDNALHRHAPGFGGARYVLLRRFLCRFATHVPAAAEPEGFSPGLFAKRPPLPRRSALRAATPRRRSRARTVSASAARPVVAAGALSCRRLCRSRPVRRVCLLRPPTAAAASRRAVPTDTKKRCRKTATLFCATRGAHTPILRF